MFCSHVRYVCLYVCMHVCTKSFLKTTTNSSCVCTHLANKADSDSDVILLNGFLLNYFSVVCVTRMMFCIVWLCAPFVYQYLLKLVETLLVMSFHLSVFDSCESVTNGKLNLKWCYSILTKSWLIFVKVISRCLLGYKHSTSAGILTLYQFVCLLVYFNL